MFALWTLVTFFRPCLRAYSKAYLTIRSAPGDRDRLDRDARVGADRLVVELLDVGDQLGGLGLALLELAAEVEVLGVLADDHEVDLGLVEVGPDALVVLAGADAGVEVECLAEVDVDRAEAGADRRGDRGLERDLGPPARLDHAVGHGGADLGHDVDAGLLDVPVDGDAGGLDAELGGLGQLGTDAVAGDQGHFMGHGRRCSVRPIACSGARGRACGDRTRWFIIMSAGTPHRNRAPGARQAGPTAAEGAAGPRSSGPPMLYSPQPPRRSSTTGSSATATPGASCSTSSGSRGRSSASS